MNAITAKAIIYYTLIIIAMAVFAQIAAAGDIIKLEAKSYGVFTQLNQLKPGDTEGHTLASYEARGAGAGSNGEFTFFNLGTSDLVNGNGSHHGYLQTTDKDGDVYFSKWQGMVTTTTSPEGRPIMKFGGTWSLTRGNGKYENATGDGTYKGWFIGQGIYTNIVEGEITLK
ncbi:MAG: hypothetical protein QNJ22_23135 [Desulfosarcinaceae bacterium]|nr:hypothetical protein [Desulfosarcinaceae bacterium]